VAFGFPDEPRFVPAVSFTTTWFANSFCCASQTAQLNTFQLSMSSDQIGRSFVTVCYDNIVFAQGAQVPVSGINGGDGVNGFTLLWSGAVATIPNMTCLGTNGRFDGA
jgi:hypothetical protein